MMILKAQRRTNLERTSTGEFRPRRVSMRARSWRRSTGCVYTSLSLRGVEPRSQCYPGPISRRW